MRFNAIGPAPPKVKRGPFIPGLSAMSTNTQAFLAALAVVACSIFLRVAVGHVMNSRFAEANARLERAKVQVALINSVQAELDGYKHFAQGYGPLRDSGYAVARDLVKIGASWPNPQSMNTSLQCLTPSEDGMSYTADGVGKDYDAYSLAVHAMNGAGYVAVPLSQTDKGARQEFKIRIERVGAK